MKNQKKFSGWEEEFDIKYIHGELGIDVDNRGGVPLKEIKAFISQVEADALRRGREEAVKDFWIGKLEDQKQRVIEMVEGMKKRKFDCDCYGLENCECWKRKDGFDTALDELITKLKEI